MSFVKFSAVLLFFAGIGLCDINSARKDALKEVENSALLIIKVGNETNQILTWKPQKIESLYSQAYSLGDSILRNSMDELQKETKLNYMKAEIKGCSNAVYSCLATTSNSGEGIVKDNFRIFADRIWFEKITFTKTQADEIGKWRKEMDQMEAAYRKNYADTTFKIVNAQTEAVIKTVLQSFANATKTFETKIKSINSILDNLQFNCALKLQTHTATLLNDCNSTKKTTYDRMNQCFGKLLLNFITN